MPDLREDPISGRLVAIAPGRAARPGARRPAHEQPDARELEACPFCAGHEERTPPEVFALGPAGRAPDTPGWSVRVVPNLYPAFARQEVVVHAPRHVRSLVDLAGEELAGVAAAWQARAAAGGPGYLHALVNEGREAGASLAHSHSQLVWLPRTPPGVAAELRPDCGVCAALRGPAELALAGRDGVVLRVAWAGRLPYELLVAPVVHETEPFASPRLAAALALAAEGLRRLHAREGRVPANLWLHAGGGHWHLELVPRLAVLAGIELGAGVHVNDVRPEDAAAALATT